MIRGLLCLALLALWTAALPARPAADQGQVDDLPWLAQEAGSAAATPVDELPPLIRRAYVIGIQEELRGRGYDVGPVDGVDGRRTRRAMSIA